MQNVLTDAKLDAGPSTGKGFEPQNPTVTSKRQRTSVGFLDNKSRITPTPAKSMNRRSGVLREREAREYADMIQQRGLPDRRYAQNNIPSQELKYYTGGSWDMNKHRLEPKSYVYRKSGVPYIPAWKVLDEQPAINFFDHNPSNATQVMVPDVYYQEQDRAANPRTEVQTAPQVQYERTIEHFMTNFLLRDKNAWNRHMLLNYVRGHPGEFYQPVQIFQEPLSSEERIRYEQMVKSRGILRRPNGKFVDVR